MAQKVSTIRSGSPPTRGCSGTDGGSMRAGVSVLTRGCTCSRAGSLMTGMLIGMPVGAGTIVIVVGLAADRHCEDP